MNDLLNKLGLIEKSPLDRLYAEPSAFNLKNTPKNIHTYEILKYVCSKDGLALKHASKKLISAELCEIAVRQNSIAISYVPDKIIKSAGHEWYKYLCMIAFVDNGFVINYIPEKEITEDIIEMALMNGTFPQQENYFMKFPVVYASDKFLTKDFLEKVVARVPMCIKDIPKKKMSTRLYNIAVKNNGLALRYVPEKYINKEMVDNAISQNADSIQFVPEVYLSQTMCDDCFERNIGVLVYLPVRYITKEMCLRAINSDLFGVLKYETDAVINFSDVPASIRNDKNILDAIIDKDENNILTLMNWNSNLLDLNRYDYKLNKRGEVIEPLQKESFEYLNTKYNQIVNIINRDKYKAIGTIRDNILSKMQLKHPSTKDISKICAITPKEKNEMVIHDISLNGTVVSKFYYISDIHLEHQISNVIKKTSTIDYKSLRNIENKIKHKISEMLLGINRNDDILLIGGDVSSSPILTELFYRELYKQWCGGYIISVLGNHELWDGTSLIEWNDSGYHARPVDDIISDYKKSVRKYSILLENEIYIKYKNKTSKIISEENIINSAIDDLKEVLENCSVIILGGLGYSGLNPKYNAEAGLYRKAICSISEDKTRTERFKKVYEKVSECAKEQKVIVLTHNPIYDWTDKQVNPKWIYVNGHTHINAIDISEKGAIILSDNQIGYKPSKWKLNAFTTDIQWYDPFNKYKDGIYNITSDEYRDFNIGRGILCNGCSYSGKLYMLKRNNMYMFLLDSGKSLCLMVGGRRSSLTHSNIQYYYDNLQIYCEKIKNMIRPYQEFMMKLSDEIKKIGGTGYVHGCIVDISFFSHIYVNPFDGKITPYWALNVTSQKVYENVYSLLSCEEPHLFMKYTIENSKKNIPLICDATCCSDSNEIIAIPKWILGTEIYKASRIMRSIQYVWEQNVIRIWNDNVLLKKEENNYAMIDKKNGD